jgi:sec-independent protein translocase protein TatC
MTAPTVDYESKKKSKEFDPDSYRMTIGEHLEELRWRLILGLSGFLIAAIACMATGDWIVRIFLRPLILSLERAHQNPQIYYTEVAESFMVYLKVSMICGAAIASPWLLYQLWQFVAAGLYPRERHYITKYLPLSIILLITGMVFLYFVVLPLMMTFFLEFNFGAPDLIRPAHIDQSAATQPAYVVPSYAGDPPNPVERQLWFDHDQYRLKIHLEGKTNVIPLLSGGLASPLITLATYIDMVVAMLLSFGLAFQMPLVVLALVRIGIVEVPQLKKMRRIVYFSMSIVAAFIVPDVVTGMVALLIPLILLFEMGLWLARDKPPVAS